MFPPPENFNPPGPPWVWLLFGLAMLAVFAWGFWKLRRARKHGHRTEKTE